MDFWARWSDYAHLVLQSQLDRWTDPEDLMPATHILFLPGAGGSPKFWRPLGDMLPSTWRKTYVGWPGLGDQPHDPHVQGLNDLVDLAERHIDGPVIIAAQSMGGIIAVRRLYGTPAGCAVWC
jgi:surfactin synthase thioesterase subunit